MNVAIIGLGFMGAVHAKAWRSVQGAKLAGVVSSDPSKRVAGNLGGAAEPIELGDARLFPTFHDVLADPSIDAVDICLPTDMHERAALDALGAGKHVLVEKPMALSAEGARSMCSAAERARRVLMAGHVLRFIPAYRRLAAWVRGRQIDSAVFRRQCGIPSWSSWLPDPRRSGGAMLDLLIHDIDFCVSLWGMPRSVSLTGEYPVRAELNLPGIPLVVIKGGWSPDPALPFLMEYSVASNGEMFAWSSSQPDEESGDPFAAELQYFTDCVRTGAPPDLCPPEQSAQAVALARFMLESRDNNGAIVRTP
jgi:predicted dehydrogenase